MAPLDCAPSLSIMPGTDDEGRQSRFSQTPLTQTGRRKRTRVFTSDERATHRVIEKQRREALNTQFIASRGKANAVSSLAMTRRLSKAIIVSEAIGHQKQREQRLGCAQQIHAMRAEQESVLSEINSLRLQVGITHHKEVEALNAEALEILAVEDEVFGTFPAGFGDNGDDANDGDDDMGVDAGEEGRDCSAVRHSRRSTSPSMSHGSSFSRSPANSTVTRAAGAIFISPSPPAQPPMSPMSPAGDAQSSNTPGTPPLGPDLRRRIIGLRQPPGTTHGYISTGVVFRSATEVQVQGNPVSCVEDVWNLSLLQQQPGAEMIHGAGLLETGGFPVGVGVQYHAPIPGVHLVHYSTPQC
ncbi:hypothetical protein B0H17DRAFT_1130424 [Mycena rosella]|uniref:BHLH domain-containing protein n=1 Tax=Mycena rosella TaxID=1033263 RepID=A0AAD7DRQ4_MYCRO|nr:hypothetical protein B0H17DRAFT_1130424 [Mycena rosella]